MTAGLLPLPRIRSVRWPALDAEVFDVGGAGLRDSKAVQAEQDRQGGVVVVVALRREEEPTEFGTVQSATLRG